MSAVTTKPAPTVHYRTLITWLAVYPTVTLASILLGPHTAHLPLALRTLILTALVVPVVSYGLTPVLLRAYVAVTGRASYVLYGGSSSRTTATEAGGAPRGRGPAGRVLVTGRSPVLSPTPTAPAPSGSSLLSCGV
jgi:hypothetical protein